MPDSSPTDALLDSSPNTAAYDAAPAAAETESSPSSVLDAVEAALDPDAASEDSRSEDETSVNERVNREDPESSSLSEPDEVPEEEIRDYSPRAQERIRELVGVKNELRGQVEELTTENEEFRSKAHGFEALTSYLRENDISSTEANNALEITRLIKGHDYDRAFQIVAPIYQELAKRSGEVLEEDLREDVRLGHISLPRAKEIQRGRAVESNARVRDQSRTEAEARRSQQADNDAHTEHVHAVAKASDEWAAAKAQNDQDWKQKEDLVASQVNVLVTQEGFPKTIDEAIAMNERALKQVEKSLGSIERTRQPANQPRNNAGPKTALEALEVGLAQQQ